VSDRARRAPANPAPARRPYSRYVLRGADRKSGFWQGLDKSIMISEVYDAFVAAGALEEKARRAAEVLAVYESRFAQLANDMHLIKWMLGFVMALLSAVALKLFLH
jgi:hypothetical protein